MVEYNLLFETSTAAATAAILSIVIELEVTDIERVEATAATRETRVL
jgi:hypothetical protein